MTVDPAETLAELTALDPALGLLIERDRKLGRSDKEIVDSIRTAVNEETRRRAALTRKEQRNA